MGEQMADSRPLLPRKKPWWIAVLFGMVLFGYLQEDAKIKLNHYTDVGARYGDFYTYGFEECRRRCTVHVRDPKRLVGSVCAFEREQFLCDPEIRSMCSIGGAQRSC